MQILIFGKDGQLGKAFSNLFASLALPKSTRVHFVGREQCDLSDRRALDALLDQSNANLIINASAYTAVDKAQSEVELAFAINAVVPELMAQYAAKHGATFLHYSTDYVFDGEKFGFYLEDDQCNPLSVYGKSKAAGEEAIARAFVNAGTGQYAIFRTSWVYGDGSNFIRTILRLAKERDQLRVIEDQFGVPTSAEWLAQISLRLALNADGQLNPFPSGIYHAVPAGETSWYGLAQCAVRAAIAAGVQLKITPELIQGIPAVEYPLPAPRPMNSRMGTHKLQSVFASSTSYNGAKVSQEFPAWEPMVEGYIRKLVNDGCI
jgi:dTDP-4-dehydrorhamnose reductase